MSTSSTSPCTSIVLFTMKLFGCKWAHDVRDYIVTRLEAWTEDYDDNLSNAQLEDTASFSYRQVVGSLLYLAV
jgi:hypothetical protein